MSEEIKYIGMVEIGESVVYIEKENNILYAGTSSNSGIARQHEHVIDNCFSLDENLQDFIEQIEFEELEIEIIKEKND